MNPTELTALSQALSNDARALYCIGLRPEADKTTGQTPPLNYKQLLAMLNAKETRFTLGRHINALLKELVDAGLVAVDDDQPLNKSFNGKQISLPLLAIRKDDYASLHLTWQNMNTDWQPHDALFNDLAHLVGIIDKEYTQAELGDFIAYWMGRPQMQFSQFQWTQKFVFHLKNKRLAKGLSNIQKIGSQAVTPKAGVEADENARKLVEKYSKKPE